MSQRKSKKGRGRAGGRQGRQQVQKKEERGQRTSSSKAGQTGNQEDTPEAALCFQPHHVPSLSSKPRIQDPSRSTSPSWPSAYISALLHKILNLLACEIGGRRESLAALNQTQTRIHRYTYARVCLHAHTHTHPPQYKRPHGDGSHFPGSGSLIEALLSRRGGQTRLIRIA